jgi:hypothetical protein
METAHVALGLSIVMPVAMFLLTFLFSRGDKGAEKLGELSLQIANLRTELAQGRLDLFKELDTRFVTRAEYMNKVEIIEFAKALTLETHKRLHPDAAIHQPGGGRG